MMAMSLANQVEEDIVFGLYPPGSHLVEDRLQTRFQLTRHALRAAMAELEAGGLVRRIPNRGMQVVEPTPDEIDELYAIRTILEVEAAAMTRLPADRAFLTKMESLCDTHEEATQARDMRAVFRANIAFHAMQFSICPNLKFQEAIRDYARKVHVVRASAYGDLGQLVSVVAQHRDIVMALAGSDGKTYCDAVRAHLPASTVAYRRGWMVKYGRCAAG